MHALPAWRQPLNRHRAPDILLQFTVLLSLTSAKIDHSAWKGPCYWQDCSPFFRELKNLDITLRGRSSPFFLECRATVVSFTDGSLLVRCCRQRAHQVEWLPPPSMWPVIECRVIGGKA